MNVFEELWKDTTWHGRLLKILVVVWLIGSIWVGLLNLI